MTTIKNWIQGTATGIGLSFAALALAQGGMMGGDQPMMRGGKGSCPAFGKHYGPMMHAEDVDLDVKNVEKGIQISWTSDDKNKVKRLQKMGQHMEKMHSGQRSKSSQTDSQNGAKDQSDAE